MLWSFGSAYGEHHYERRTVNWRTRDYRGLRSKENFFAESVAAERGIRISSADGSRTECKRRRQCPAKSRSEPERHSAAATACKRRLALR